MRKDSVSLPNFIIAGFPKSGTTSLFYYLREHPNVFIPHVKEMNYFTQKNLNQLQSGPGDKMGTHANIDSLEKYKSYYKGVSNKKAIGDASPSYITFSECFSEIKETLNDPKVIVIIRDPINRAFSNYLHMVRLGREDLSFHDALLKEDERIKEAYSPFWYYKTHSLYFNSIEAVKRQFKEVLIVVQEELKQNPLKVVKEVYKFLEIEDSFVPENLSTNYNTGGIYKKNFITNFLIKPSVLKQFLLKHTPVLKKLKPFKDKVLSKYQKRTPEISEETRLYLESFFKKDVNKLRDLGIDFSLWENKY